MKKLIAALAIAAAVLLVAGFVYVLMFMEDTENPPAGQSQSGGGSTSNARLNAPKAVETDADVLDALDYYTQRNQDTVGWLRVPGTTINNSVLQSHDNMTYLRTNEAREFIQKTGLVVMTYPKGIVWGEDEELVRLVIGIASKGEEHLDILNRIVEVCESEEDTDALVDNATVEELYKKLNGLS